MTFEKDKQFHLFVLVSLAHGLRCSETLALRAEDVQGSYLKIDPLKHGVDRLEPFAASTSPIFDVSSVATYAGTLNCNARLFPFSRATADRHMKLYCKQAGIPACKAHCHSLRHSTAMWVFKRTTSLGSVKQQLRHKSWASSLVYLCEMDATKAYTAVQESVNNLTKGVKA